VIGVDVGGTKIRSGVVDREGSVYGRYECESPGSSEEDVLHALEEAVEAVLDETIGAIGFGVPANLDRDTGRVLRAVNLPFDDFDLAGHARARFGLPVAVENDANSAALAEWKLGAGRGVSNLVLLTLGTGVGGGVIFDGALFRGWAELGHVAVVADGPPCQGTCTGRGHLEAVASGSAADRAAEKLWGDGATAELLVGRADEGDADALEALSQMGHLLGVGIGSFVNVFAPDLVVVGGGFGLAAFEHLLPAALEIARREALEPARAGLRIVPAELGEDAGVIGAGLLALEALDQ
jgi:glucokinase